MYLFIFAHKFIVPECSLDWILFLTIYAPAAMLPLDELVPIANGNLVLVKVAGGGGHGLVHVSDLKQHSFCRRLLALQPDNV